MDRYNAAVVERDGRLEAGWDVRRQQIWTLFGSIVTITLLTGVGPATLFTIPFGVFEWWTGATGAVEHRVSWDDETLRVLSGSSDWEEAWTSIARLDLADTVWRFEFSDGAIRTLPAPVDVEARAALTDHFRACLEDTDVTLEGRTPVWSSTTGGQQLAPILARGVPSRALASLRERGRFVTLVSMVVFPLGAFRTVDWISTTFHLLQGGLLGWLLDGVMAGAAAPSMLGLALLVCGVSVPVLMSILGGAFIRARRRGKIHVDAHRILLKAPGERPLDILWEELDGVTNDDASITLHHHGRADRFDLSFELPSYVRGLAVDLTRQRVRSRSGSETAEEADERRAQLGKLVGAVGR